MVQSISVKNHYKISSKAMLNYSQTFSRIIQLGKNNPALIMLGFVSVFIAELFSTSGLLLANATSFTELSPEEFFTAVADAGNDLGRLLSYTAVITVILALVWVVSAITGAGLIVGTKERLEDRPFDFATGWKNGRRLLWPFIAVDTIIFFPIFMLLLLTLGIVAGGLARAVINSETASNDDVMVTIFTSLLCALPFIMLTIPAGFLTAIYRYIALRDVALNGTGIRDSIRNVWPTIKKASIGVLVLAVVTIALSAFPSAVFEITTAVLQILPDIPRILIGAIIRLISNAAVFITISMLWTIAVRTWWEEDTSSEDTSSS